jgi:hypothetical protein
LIEVVTEGRNEEEELAAGELDDIEQGPRLDFPFDFERHGQPLPALKASPAAPAKFAHEKISSAQTTEHVTQKPHYGA